MKRQDSRPAALVDARFGLSGIVCAMLSGFALPFGLAASGGGHGTYTIWAVGLVLAALAWLCFLVSTITTLWLRRGRGFLGWWFPLVLALLIASSWLGVWGLSG